MTEFRTIQCSKCQSQLKVPPARTRGKCPKCQTEFQLNASVDSLKGPPSLSRAKPPGPKPLPPNRTDYPGSSSGETKVEKSRPFESMIPNRRQTFSEPSSTGKAEHVHQPPKTSSFLTFVQQHFRATRGPVFIWLLAVACMCFFASFLKPIAGSRWMNYAMIGLAAISFLLLSLYLLGRFSDYFIRSIRTVPSSAASRTASWGAFCGLIALGLGLLSLGERFASDKGLVGSNIAWVGNIQDELSRAVGRWSSQGGGDQAAGTDGGKAHVETVEDSNFLPEENASMASTEASRAGKVNEDSTLSERSAAKSAEDGRSDRTPNTLPNSIRSENQNGTASNLSSSSTAGLAQIEVKLGIDSRALAERLISDETCLPGGTYSAKLRISEREKLWGGENAAPPPGGAF
jgi:hypothetical protein